MGPPAARTLGFELVEAHPEEGSIIVAFSGIEAFTNPFWTVTATRAPTAVDTATRSTTSFPSRAAARTRG
ncbi:hypothetical protein [Mycolicibacterium lutetiense]